MPRSQSQGYLEFRPPWNRREVRSAEDLWSHFTNYVEHSYETPLVEAKLFSGKEGLRTGALNKMRPLTIEAFCNYLGVSPTIWRGWKKKALNDDEYFHEVMDLIDQNINDQMFQGAASDFFNASIISRKLGLVDKTEVLAPAADPTEGQERYLAVHIHPDDPDPLDAPRPLYSMDQIESGVPFAAPVVRDAQPDIVDVDAD